MNIEEQERIKDVMTVLDSLQKYERMVVAMHFLDEMTVTEMSKDLPWSKSRISQVLQKALRKLRHPKRANLLYPHYAGRTQPWFTPEPIAYRDRIYAKIR